MYLSIVIVSPSVNSSLLASTLKKQTGELNLDNVTEGSKTYFSFLTRAPKKGISNILHLEYFHCFTLLSDGPFQQKLNHSMFSKMLPDSF